MIPRFLAVWRAKNRLTRALVLSAGAIMNVVLAIALWSVSYMVGTPVPVEGAGAGVYAVGEGSPAQLAGLRPGDTIVEIEGVVLSDANEAKEQIQRYLGQEMTLVVRREGVLLPPITLTPRVDPPPNEGAVGVAIDLPLEVRSFPSGKPCPRGPRRRLAP